MTKRVNTYITILLRAENAKGGSLRPMSVTDVHNLDSFIGSV